MRIGELSQATDTKAETIRYYEREGILPPADRTNSNYRDYSGAHVSALLFVRRARQLGFTMAQVRQLLALSDHDDKPCEDVDRLVGQQLEVVQRKIADLKLLQVELSQLARSCRGKRIGDCRIVESLGRR